MLSEHDVCDTVYMQMSVHLLTKEGIQDLATARKYDVDDLGFQLSYILYCGKDWQRKIATGTTNIKLYPLVPRYTGDSSTLLSMEEYQKQVEEAKKEFDPEPAFVYVRKDFYEVLETFRGDMGKHYFTVIDETRLNNFISGELQRLESSREERELTPKKLNRVRELVCMSGKDISKFLSLTASMKDNQLRRLMRIGALAQMYGISETNPGDGNPYFLIVNDSLAILQTKQFTFILNPNGNLKLTPYHFKLDDSRQSKWGWQTCAIKNRLKKYGLYSLDGQELLPCEYDDVNIWDYDTPVVTIDGNQFKVTINSGKAEIEK